MSKYQGTEESVSAALQTLRNETQVAVAKAARRMAIELVIECGFDADGCADALHEMVDGNRFVFLTHLSHCVALIAEDSDKSELSEYGEAGDSNDQTVRLAYIVLSNRVRARIEQVELWEITDMRPTIGPISEGTLRPEDLAEAFVSECERLGIAHTPAGYSDVAELREQITDYADDKDELAYSISAATEILETVAGEWLYFGASEGDGACFGFWPTDEALEHAASPSENFTGELARVVSEINQGWPHSEAGRPRNLR